MILRKPSGSHWVHQTPLDGVRTALLDAEPLAHVVAVVTLLLGVAVLADGLLLPSEHAMPMGDESRIVTQERLRHELR